MKTPFFFKDATLRRHSLEDVTFVITPIRHYSIDDVILVKALYVLMTLFLGEFIVVYRTSRGDNTRLRQRSSTTAAAISHASG